MKYRRIIVTITHLAAVVLSYYLAFLIQFNGDLSEKQFELFQKTLPWLVIFRGAMFIPFRLYEGLWRYTGIWDLRNIIMSVVISSTLFALIPFAFISDNDFWRSVIVIDTLLLIIFLGGIRLTRRIYREIGHTEREKKILIFGAGDAGEMIVRDMKNNGFYNYEPIGFIDDDPTKVGQTIHGVRVLGTRKNLTHILMSKQPTEFLVAVPKVGPSKIREVVKALEPFKIPIKTLPNLRDLLDGKVSVDQIRNLSIEDLLDRAPVDLDPEPVHHLIEDKKVLVTGAGGSIGAELCRQIAKLKPRNLILFERHENSLYEIEIDLLDKGIKKSILCPIIGDITNESQVNSVIKEFQPNLIFHAAAHKHVPLMESNPFEAIKNNILGTRIVADAATRYGVERFILISSDKAVNPSSVMGASKRVAEFLVQMIGRESQTIFATVRFGNVLGSNGSVVPRFLEQIKAGGPITVTHPEIRRYFMLIPEAVQLVLHTAALAKAGGIFVLEMGEQIRVQELARNLIRLTGFVPDRDIQINFTGLRPGEKLFEELVEDKEVAEPSGVEKIMRIRSNFIHSANFLSAKISEVDQLATKRNVNSVIRCLREIVPTYVPVGIHEEQGQENIVLRSVK